MELLEQQRFLRRKYAEAQSIYSEQRRAAGMVLRVLRLAHDKTLAEIAETLAERVSYVSDLERGLAPLRCDRLVQLASVYGLRPGELASVLQAASALG